MTKSITNGFASIHWVTLQDYYPSNNPSNFVDKSVTNGLASTNWVNSPYQEFLATIPVVNGTATVAYANSSLVRITPTTDIVVTFDNTAYPTNGANSVIIELLAGTNTITFDTTVITNVTAPTISTNSLTSLFFRRVITNLWYGRQ